MTDQKSLLLKIRGLRIEGRADEKWFEIVHGVDLDLRRGEVMGLIGESGAGKSTIGLAAMGFTRDGCRISAGSIEFDGMELTSSPEEDLRMLRGARIAYVAQSAAASFNPAHKLIDQHTAAPVQHKIRTRRESEEDAMELYRRLRLPHPEEIGFRYPHQVSGGQLQRAMTAMAMSCRPDLIIFDEPTTALDVTTQIEGARRDPRHRRPVRHRRALHHARPRGRRADGRPHQGAAQGRRGRGGRHPLHARLAEGGLHQVPVGGAQLPATAEAARGRRRDAGDLGERGQRRLRPGQGPRRRFVRHPPRTHGGGGRRVGVGQVHRGALHHRPAAAHRGGHTAQRPGPAGELQGALEGPAPPGADDLPDGRHRTEPEEAHRRDHRAPGGLLPGAARRGPEETRGRAARPDRARALAVLPPRAVGAVRGAEAADRHRPGARRRARVHHLRRG